MGGEAKVDWDIDPEVEQIIVGTQDMLLSAALNRAYASSIYRWPMRFAALNNDCLWILDEIQLMGAGLPTSLQLQAFRDTFGTWRNCRSIWMSATVDRQSLATVDHPVVGQVFGLEASDLACAGVSRRTGACKPMVVEDWPESKELPGLAKQIALAHQPGTLTLVVLNTVADAVKIHKALAKALKTMPQPPELRLVHSHFRAADRKAWKDSFLSREATMPQAGRIIVSTQVVEAGVDLSAARLFTAAAPWASMVQRFGRCNRDGEYGDSAPFGARVVVWQDTSKKQSLYAPYARQAVCQAVDAVKRLSDVGPDTLRSVDAPAQSIEAASVIRRSDLLELFDTTPDLTGNDLDVQRWIRDGHDINLFMYWRVGDPVEDESVPDKSELCPVSVSQASKFAERKGVKLAWFDPLDDAWCFDSARILKPGRVIRCRSEDGGYLPDTGFDHGVKTQVTPITIPPNNIGRDSIGHDALSLTMWQDIADHTDAVMSVFDSMSQRIELPWEVVTQVRTAIRWHDRGKAIPAFQERLPVNNRPEQWKERTDVGKAPSNAWSTGSRKPLRHELASALAMLDLGLSDLSAYLAASHHGKIRLALRSFPGEADDNQDIRVCAGVRDGDFLPPTRLGDSVAAPEFVVNLDPMEMGLSSITGPSWVERTTELLHSFGPFKLAFLELLIRASDWRASAVSPNVEGEDA